MYMPVKFEMKVVQVGNSLKVTIPVEVARHLEIEKGDTVELWVDNNHMVTQKKKEDSP
jgi:antitoxin component of MazEF toxin-antitoxin module